MSLEADRKICEQATPGPWRARRSSLDPDQPGEPPACWGIAAGAEKWRHNAGHFHPADAEYPQDEIHVVEIGYDRDYGTPEAAIPREGDAAFIAHFNPAYLSLYFACADLCEKLAALTPGPAYPDQINDLIHLAKLRVAALEEGGEE
jgi:hypothetical protein